MKRRLGLVILTAISLCVFAFAASAGEAKANFYANAPAAAAPAAPGVTAQGPHIDDGFDQLPRGKQALSMSTLYKLGLVHKPTNWKPGNSPQHPRPTNQPYSTITWGAPFPTSQSFPGFSTGYPNEPATGMAQSNPLNAVISGNNFSNVPCDGYNTTTDGGLTWSLPVDAFASTGSNCGYGDGVNGYLANSINGGNNVLAVALNPSGDGADMTTSLSTDGGHTWTGYASNIDAVNFFDDREYVWSDNNPASPFYGRVYVTEALFDPAGSGSYNSITVRMSSDGGATWSGVNPLVDDTEFATGTAHNEYPSLAILPNGDVVCAWHRGLCCGSPPFVGTDNQVYISRSTDGGVTWSSGDPSPAPISAVTVPLANAVSFNSSTNAGFRWSDTPNIAADPSNGDLYVVYTAYRTANTNNSSAIYLIKSTDEGNTWSAPTIPFNDPNPTNYQYFGWVQVSKDHAVHVTYSSSQGADATLAHFYTQSTDGGNTFGTPFMTSPGTYGPGFFMGDYEGAFIGGRTAGSASIVVGWTGCADAAGTNENQWAIIGTFPEAACGTYSASTTPVSSATFIYPGVNDTGNHCDDCTTNVALPFTFTFHGTPYTSVNVDSNGTLQFGSNISIFTNTCLPNNNFFDTIFPFWVDQLTTAAGDGIFTSTSGSAPNRIFNIEWRTHYFNIAGGTANYEVRLYEDEDRFDVIYGATADSGATATAGVQIGDGSTAGGSVSQFSCNAANLPQFLFNAYTESCCPVLHTVGDVESQDPVETNRLFRSGITSTCAAPTVCPGPFVTAGPYSYDIYPLFNGNDVTECVTVTLGAGTCTGTNSVFATAYLGTFDPTNLCNNYLADAGSSPSAAGGGTAPVNDHGGSPTNAPQTFSFDVPAGAAFTIIVNEDAAYPAFCTGYTLDVTIPPPTAIASPNVSICQGGSTTLSGSGGATCSWTPSTGLSDPNSCHPTASPATTTTYTLTVTDSCGVSSSNAPTVTVTVDVPPPATIIPGGNLCIGVTLTASAGSSWLWSPTGETTQSITATMAASYSVTITDAAGCSATSAPTVINPLPLAAPSGSASICLGASTPLTGSGGVSCSWSPCTGLDNCTSCTPNASPTVTTTYTLTVTDANGCSSIGGPNIITNPGFETGDLTGWTIDGSNNAPVADTAQAHSGTYSARVGEINPTPEPTGDSAMFQAITVPAAGGTLSFWKWEFTQDSITFDWQDAYITDATGTTILTTIYHECNNGQAWINVTQDMSAWVGQTVALKVLTHEDGFGDDTAQYIDDVFLEGPATVTVTLLPSPTPTISVLHCLPPNTPGLSASVAPVAGDTFNWTLTGGTITGGQGTASITFTSGGVAQFMTIAVSETSPSGCVGNANDTMQVNFADVTGGPFYNFICSLARNGVSGGCGGGNFCPANPVLRSQMAVFLLRSEHGSSYTPPACTVASFTDVPCSNPFASWIYQLVAEQVTGGCTATTYCPGSSVQRNSMAVFLLVTEHGAGYVPPACTPPGQFTDVPCPGGGFTNFIYQLVAEGITGGCTATTYCPTQAVSRAQMAVFLVTTFNLP
jgi:hypothetical protein